MHGTTEYTLYINYTEKSKLNKKCTRNINSLLNFLFYSLSKSLLINNASRCNDMYVALTLQPWHILLIFYFFVIFCTSNICNHVQFSESPWKYTQKCFKSVRKTRQFTIHHYCEMEEKTMGCQKCEQNILCEDFRRKRPRGDRRIKEEIWFVWYNYKGNQVWNWGWLVKTVSLSLMALFKRKSNCLLVCLFCMTYHYIWSYI